MGRAGLINSGGASGSNDLQEAVITAVINKRAGGSGLISGRKAFQKPMKDGVAILNAIQDVYLSKEITLYKKIYGLSHQLSIRFILLYNAGCCLLIRYINQEASEVFLPPLE